MDMKYTAYLQDLEKAAKKLTEHSERGDQRNSKIAAVRTPLGAIAICVDGMGVRFGDGSKDITLSAMVHDKTQSLLTLEQHRVILPSKSKDPAVLAQSVATAQIPEVFTKTYDLSPSARLKPGLKQHIDISESRIAFDILRRLSSGRASHDPHKNERAREDFITVFAAEGVNAHADAFPEPSEALLTSFKPEQHVDDRIITLMHRAAPVDVAAYAYREHGATSAP